jgi:serpin B
MTLAILAEITDGEARKQILDVIGISTIGELRRQANSLWNSIYCDNGASKRIIANSLWLDDDVQINRDTVERIASGYYASSYQGDFDDSEYLEEYCDWMNENTGNLFDFSPEKIGFDSLTAITLTSTLYLETLWAYDEGFTSNSTSLEKFHTNSGDVSAYFMHSTRNEKLHAGEDFYAISLSLAIGGDMWFVLPYEDATVDEILSERHFIEYTMGIKPENSREYSITMSIPKFDVSTEKSISEDIKKLGITEVFKNTADFSPLSKTILTLNDIHHGSRLKIDEKGVVGGAYVEAPIVYGEPPFPLGTKFDFVLDRPFIFVVTSSAGIPIFVGVVNDPTKN